MRRRIVNGLAGWGLEAFDQLCDRDFLVKACGRPELVYRVLALYPVVRQYRQSFLFVASRAGG